MLICYFLFDIFRPASMIYMHSFNVYLIPVSMSAMYIISQESYEASLNLSVDK